MKRYGETKLPGISEQKMKEIIATASQEDMLENAIKDGPRQVFL